LRQVDEIVVRNTAELNKKVKGIKWRWVEELDGQGDPTGQMIKEYEDGRDMYEETTLLKELEKNNAFEVSKLIYDPTNKRLFVIQGAKA